MQAADQPGSNTPASPTLEAALSRLSPTQAKPIVRSSAATFSQAQADACADMQFSMSMQLDARASGALAGPQHEVGALLRLRHLGLITLQPQEATQGVPTLENPKC